MKYIIEGIKALARARVFLKDSTYETKEIMDQTYNRVKMESIPFEKTIFIEHESEKVLDIELFYREFIVKNEIIKLGDIETNMAVAIYEDQNRFVKVNPEFPPVLGGHREFELSNYRTIESLFRVAEQLGLAEKVGDNRYKIYICRNYENEGWSVTEDKIQNYRWHVYEPHVKDPSHWATNMITNQYRKMFQR